jgi:hypothetical protein
MIAVEECRTHALPALPVEAPSLQSIISGDDDGLDLNCVDWDHDASPASGPTTSTSHVTPPVLGPHAAEDFAPSDNAPMPRPQDVSVSSLVGAVPPYSPIGSPVHFPISSPIRSPVLDAVPIASILSTRLPSDVESAQLIPPAHAVVSASASMRIDTADSALPVNDGRGPVVKKG